MSTHTTYLRRSLFAVLLFGISTLAFAAHSDNNHSNATHSDQLLLLLQHKITLQKLQDRHPNSLTKGTNIERQKKAPRSSFACPIGLSCHPQGPLPEHRYVPTKLR